MNNLSYWEKMGLWITGELPEFDYRKEKEFPKPKKQPKNNNPDFGLFAKC